MIIDPSTSAPSITRYAPPQLKELQIHGLALITCLLPWIPEHFHSINAHLIFNQFLSTYTDYERRIAVMKAISSTSTYEFFKKDYAELKTGIIETLVTIISSTRESPLDMRELAFNIIAYLCKDFRPHQKEFRRKGGIEIVKENLAFNDVD